MSVPLFEWNRHRYGRQFVVYIYISYIVRTKPIEYRKSRERTKIPKIPKYIPIRCMYVCMYAIVVVAAFIVIVLLLGGSSRWCGVRVRRYGRLFYSYG